MIGLATYLNNGHIPRFSSNSEKKNYTVSVNDVNNLDIDIIDSDVTLEENTSSKNIEIEYYTALERKVNIEHTGNKLSIRENKNIVGIKEATGDVSRVTKIKALAGQDFIVLSGDDATSLEAMKLGAEGVISVTNNLASKDMADMCRYALSGDFTKAEEINARLMRLHNDLFIESNPIPVKWAAYRLGLIKSPHLRLPLTILSENVQPKVEEALKIAGLL